MNREDVIWAGAEEYQGHSFTGGEKVKALQKLQDVYQFANDEMLFIDDNTDYVDAAKESDFNTLLVPQKCFSPARLEAKQAREEFFNLIKNNVLEPIAPKTTFFQRHPVLKSALIGGAIAVGIGIGLPAAILATLFLTGGAAAPIIIGAGIAIVSTLGVMGTVSAAIGLVGAVFGFGAAFVGGIEYEASKPRAENRVSVPTSSRNAVRNPRLSEPLLESSAARSAPKASVGNSWFSCFGQRKTSSIEQADNTLRPSSPRLKS